MMFGKVIRWEVSVCVCCFEFNLVIKLIILFFGGICIF